MALNKKQRAIVKAMFGDRCAYCGQALGDRWHADHVQAVMRETRWVRSEYVEGVGYKPGRFVQTGKLWRPENERLDNYFPACVPCNIDKGPCDLEHWRQYLQGLAASIRRNYAPFRHAERFGLVSIDDAPIVFHFEKYLAAAQVIP